MKRFLPVFAIGMLCLGACGLEKPPAKLEFPKSKEEAAAPAETAAPAAAPAATEAPADPKLAAGKTVYETKGCNGCHDAGMMGAPKPGDKAAWKDRIAQGEDVMVKKSIEGFTGKGGMMPAKGSNAALTDEEVKNAVAYLASLAK
jgi:cytochrome c5